MFLEEKIKMLRKSDRVAAEWKCLGAVNKISGKSKDENSEDIFGMESVEKMGIYFSEGLVIRVHGVLEVWGQRPRLTGHMVAECL